VATACALWATSAYSFLCPGGPGEGQMQIGVARGAGGAPICGVDPSYQGQTYLNAIEGAARDREVAAQISSAHRRDTIDFLTRAIASTEAMRRSMAGMDPNFSFAHISADYYKGAWTFPDLAKRKAKPGEYCTVLFGSNRGLMGLFGPGGEYRGAMLVFWNDGLPRPAEQQIVTVGLGQNDDTKVQTVKAFSYTDPHGGLGAVALAVPSLQALLSTMEDQQRFRVLLDNKLVVDMGWHSGLTARDALKACVDQAPK
jgi:hypothetical protein